ncbi:MAG: Crp/Fnr family transcriptional regulator [Hydrogenophaga sp.]|nr:Crp/Fnr family transcriptional regulator [Hydrogenophaga sp.]
MGPSPCEEAGLERNSLCESTRIALREGVRLFERGGAASAIYVVQSGLVKETIPGPDGGECIVRLVGRSGVVGLSALVGQFHRHSAFVMQSGSACRIPMARLEQVRKADPGACQRMLADWQLAADGSDRIVSEFAHGPARARLARALLHLHAVPRDDPGFCPRRTDLADLLSITPVSVTRLLGELRREGLIAVGPDHCLVLSVEKLRRIGYPNAEPSVNGNPGSASPDGPAWA